MYSCLFWLGASAGVSYARGAVFALLHVGLSPHQQAWRNLGSTYILGHVPLHGLWLQGLEALSAS